MENEIWRDIIGYEGLYMVSNMGRVKSLNYNRTGGEQILLPYRDNYGYYRVILSKNGKITCYRVHRLVAMAFIPTPHNYPLVNHRDEDKTNNRADNLEWCDHAYNNNFGNHNEKMAKTKSKEILQFDKNHNLINRYSSAKEASLLCGYNAGNISQCCKGKRKTAHGYIWKYKTDVA